MVFQSLSIIVKKSFLMIMIVILLKGVIEVMLKIILLLLLNALFLSLILICCEKFMSKIIDFLFENPSRIINTDVYSKIISENPESICFFSLVNFQCCVVLDKRLKKYAIKYRGFDTFSRFNWDKWNVYSYYDSFELARDSFRSFLNEFVSRTNLFFNGFEEIRKNELPF